jgi:hypothetical protein
MHPSISTGALACVLLLSRQASAQEPSAPPQPPPQQDLTELSLEELLNLEVTVTSAARHEQPLS